MILEKGTKLVMIGDSITDCGRTRPVAEHRAGLGNGYVSLVQAHLEAFRADMGIRVFNMGISGNTVRQLKARWETDVLALKPNWLSVMIGINDVWRHFDNPFMTDIHVTLKEYEKTLDDLIFKAQTNGIKIILMTPYFIETNKSEPMRAMMDEYATIVEKISRKRKTIFVDTQLAFDKTLRHLHPMALASDGVHPSMAGHLIIAKAFLSAIGM
jgi:lysophospholipase L1-like esterase